MVNEPLIEITKFLFALNIILMIVSDYNFAHAMTAELCKIVIW